MPRNSPTPTAHTKKHPESCPYCESSAVSRKGTRKKKLEVVQLWRCGSCKRVFTPAPAALRNKTYPLRTMRNHIPFAGDAVDIFNRLLDEAATRKVASSSAQRTADDVLYGIQLELHFPSQPMNSRRAPSPASPTAPKARVGLLATATQEKKHA